jgi:hypothetical protein
MGTKSTDEEIRHLWLNGRMIVITPIQPQAHLILAKGEIAIVCVVLNREKIFKIRHKTDSNRNRIEAINGGSFSC